MSAAIRSSRPAPAPAPRAFGVRANDDRWEVHVEGGPLLTRHAELRDALALAAALARRAGACLWFQDRDGRSRPVAI